MNKPMSEEEVIQFLANLYPTAAALRRAHPDIATLLIGEFGKDESGKDVFSAYELPNGVVVSRPLEQGLAINPIIGVIPPGEFEFNTCGNEETITVLQGKLIVGVNMNASRVLVPYEQIIAPPRADISFFVKEGYACYFCNYRKI